MAILELSDAQILNLVRQLPQQRQDELLRSLLSGQWPVWERLSAEGQAGARKAAAARGLNWDTMSDEQRQDFIDDIVHEDRECRP